MEILEDSVAILKKVKQHMRSQTDAKQRLEELLTWLQANPTLHGDVKSELIIAKTLSRTRAESLRGIFRKGFRSSLDKKLDHLGSGYLFANAHATTFSSGKMAQLATAASQVWLQGPLSVAFAEIEQRLTPSGGFVHGSTGPDPVQTAQLANEFASKVEAALAKQELEDEQQGRPSDSGTAETKTGQPPTPIVSPLDSMNQASTAAKLGAFVPSLPEGPVASMAEKYLELLEYFRTFMGWGHYSHWWRSDTRTPNFLFAISLFFRNRKTIMEFVNNIVADKLSPIQILATLANKDPSTYLNLEAEQRHCESAKRDFAAFHYRFTGWRLLRDIYEVAQTCTPPCVLIQSQDTLWAIKTAEANVPDAWRAQWQKQLQLQNTGAKDWVTLIDLVHKELLKQVTLTATTTQGKGAASAGGRRVRARSNSPDYGDAPRRYSARDRDRDDDHNEQGDGGRPGGRHGGRYTERHSDYNDDHYREERRDFRRGSESRNGDLRSQDYQRHGRARASPQRSQGAGKGGRRGTPCKFFMAGGCTKSYCGFSHESGSTPVCYQWRDKSYCTFGDRCKFAHAPQHQAPPADRQPPAQQASQPVSAFAAFPAQQQQGPASQLPQAQANRPLLGAAPPHVHPQRQSLLGSGR